MFPAPVPADSPAPQGTWPLFTFRGIRVFLHWSWILVAVYQIDAGKDRHPWYPHIGWDIAQYLTLFVIVLMHEFGHAFATRQVGGTADQILLWPFGGIAYVRTPPRPKAYLWGIAAGPLVNAVLWPVFYGLYKLAENHLLSANPGSPNEFEFAAAIYSFAQAILYINAGLLIFNVLPIYPMDGGQLLRGLLWLKMGPAKSLLISAWIGIFAGAAVILYALIAWHAWWLAMVMGLMLHQSWMVIQRFKAAERESGGL